MALSGHQFRSRALWPRAFLLFGCDRPNAPPNRTEIMSEFTAAAACAAASNMS